MIELKNCPFCGEKVKVIQRGNSISYFVVKCEPCRAEVKGTMEDVAVARWNRRVQSDNEPQNVLEEKK